MTAAGVLHSYGGTSTHDDGHCDDAYCTGHSHKVVHCSCGWHAPSYSRWDTEWKDHFAWVSHVLSELQASRSDAPAPGPGPGVS